MKLDYDHNSREFYFADVFASRRLPADLADDPDFHDRSAI